MFTPAKGANAANGASPDAVPSADPPSANAPALIAPSGEASTPTDRLSSDAGSSVKVHDPASPTPHLDCADALAVAVVLLSSGDLDLLDRSLDALSRQDIEAPYEIIVADDAFEAATARLVGGWEQRIGRAGGAGDDRAASVASAAVARARLRYLTAPPASATAVDALNAGWRSSSAPVIAFAAVDTVPSADWLRHGLAGFADPPMPGCAGSASATASNGSGSDASVHGGGSGASASGGTNSEARIVAVFGRVDSTLPRRPTEVQRELYLRDAGRFTASNWFIRRAMLASLAGFDARFRDPLDATTDLHCRLLAGGAGIAHVAAATVAHPLAPASWGASLLELRRLSSEALLEQRHPRLYRERMQRAAPPLAHDLAVVAALLAAAVGAAMHHEVLTVAAGGTWLVLTAMLSIRRLHDTARTPAHVAEVLLTSVLMPPLALFWRAVGVVRYRTRFARP